MYEYFPPTYPSWSEIFASIQDAYMQKFLYIGIMVSVAGLWLFFRDESKSGKIRDNITGAAQMIIVFCGISLIVLYFVWKRGGL